jgi:hypothetical protein
VKHVRMLGFCLVAMFAMSVIASASASAAEPEYQSCVKDKGGQYTSKECTAASKVASGGKYERAPVTSGTTFTSKSKAATITVLGKAVKCKKDAGKGVIYPPSDSDEQITFSDCAVNGSKTAPCASEGAAKGTIITSELFTRLVYLNAGETEIGVLLYGEPVAEFKCGSEAFDIEGGAVAAVTNTAKGETWSLTVNGGGEQEHKLAWLSGPHEFGPWNLATEPGGAEATVATTEEQGPKGVGAF